MIKFLVFLACLATASVEVFATAQRPDYLHINGKNVPMTCNPLESFFEANPKKRPCSDVSSSNMWRGYVAKFEIRSSELWVDDIEIHESTKNIFGEYGMRSVLKDVFPTEEERSAKWFTGFLILPRGKIVNYVHMGYASTYESYQIMFLANGIVIAERVFSGDEYAEYKRLQFEAFSKSDRYKAMLADLKKERGDDMYMDAESFLFIFDVRFPREVLIDYKDFKPNKSVQTTPTAVTPAAGQPARQP